MKKSILVFTCLCLALPLAALADSVTLDNKGGQVTSNSSVLTLSGSTLISLSGVTSGSVSGQLGTLTLTTGSLVSGSLAAGGTFAAGGSFSIVGNGQDGLPAGNLFSGTFTTPLTWIATWMPNMGPNHQGAWIYTLKGNVTGTLNNGKRLSGTIVETTFDVSQGRQFSTTANLNSGAGTLTSVPEPSTFGLLATGLFGLALLVRRKRTA